MLGAPSSGERKSDKLRLVDQIGGNNGNIRSSLRRLATGEIDKVKARHLLTQDMETALDTIAAAVGPNKASFVATFAPNENARAILTDFAMGATKEKASALAELVAQIDIDLESIENAQG